MSNLTTYAVKGSPLTKSEVDANWEALRSFESKTGTSIVFTADALYNEATYLTSGNLTLSLTGATKSTTCVVYCDRYVPTISGEDYYINGFISSGKLNELWFHYDGTNISLNVIHRTYIATPSVTLAQSNGTNTITNISVVNADSYSILFSTTNDIDTASAVPTYNGTDSSYTHSSLSNGTTYYYWIQATGAGYLDSDYETISGTPAAPSTTNLIAFYKLNEASGTTVTDAHTSGNDATSANCTLGATGLIDDAYTFNGTTSVITASALNSSFNATDFTVMMWIKTTQSTTARLFQNRDLGALGSTKGFSIGFNGVTWGATYVDDGAGNYIQFATAPDDNYNEDDDAWHHVAFTWDTSTGTATLYIDGSELNSYTDSNLISLNLNTANNVTLGMSNSSTNIYDGDIDQVVVYQRLLDASEVATHYNLGIGLDL
jgi:hypothetical protein